MQQATHIQRPPRIGQPWPNADGSSAGIYAGIARGQDGADDYHLVLCTDIPASRLSWPDALAWAQGLGCNLPNCSEAALLFANLRSAHSTLRPAWTIDPPDGAPVLWLWEVGYDCQRQDNNKTVLAHARAVRRFNFLSLGTADNGQQASTSKASQPANSALDEARETAINAWLARKLADTNFVFLSDEAQPVKVDPADRRFYVVHPARELIACLGCMHCRDHGRSGYMCDHPAQPIDLVTGYPKINCAAARCDNPEIALEQGATTCGSDARLFQPKRKRT